MEEVSQTPSMPNPEPTAPVGESKTPARPWSINVVVPDPDNMPSDRLQARAQLVRSALSSVGSTY